MIVKVQIYPFAAHLAAFRNRGVRRGLRSIKRFARTYPQVWGASTIEIELTRKAFVRLTNGGLNFVTKRIRKALVAQGRTDLARQVDLRFEAE